MTLKCIYCGRFTSNPYPICLACEDPQLRPNPHTCDYDECGIFCGECGADHRSLDISLTMVDCRVCGWHWEEEF